MLFSFSMFVSSPGPPCPIRTQKVVSDTIHSRVRVG